MSLRTCKNKLAPESLPGYFIQDGWTEDGRRRMVLHRTQWKPAGCGANANERAADPECEGCKWRYHQ